jgi:hypothetical protein
MLHWLAVELALLDTSNTRFTLVCGFILILAVMVYLIDKGRTH